MWACALQSSTVFSEYCTCNCVHTSNVIIGCSIGACFIIACPPCLYLNNLPVLYAIGMAKEMLLLRKQQPSKMWKLYHRMLISPYKPSGQRRHRTSDYAILASPHKRSKLQSQRNLLKELNSVSLKIIKG